ncbi:MAG: hypothetical protein NTW21_19295 [Verrucomicrobia bacterium]|nr:hypothetical protein [Verrucomicrobiota bacterium]
MPATAIARHRALILVGSIAAARALVASAAPAATRTKANNSTALNLAGSWDTLPGPADIAQTAGTAGTLANVSNPTANDSCGAAATLTGAITANTLRFTGGGASLANVGFGTTLNGLMQAGAGDLTISGAGNLVIGANRELVLTANAQATTIASPIVNHSAGASALTYGGSGNLTLTAVSTAASGIPPGPFMERGWLSVPPQGLQVGVGACLPSSSTSALTDSNQYPPCQHPIPSKSRCPMGRRRYAALKPRWRSCCPPARRPTGCPIWPRW